MKTPISTKEAPAAIGPYSQGIKVGSFFFFSGQIALDPSTGSVVGETIEAQTEQVLKNIDGLLRSQGLDFSNVVKTTVFLRRMEDFSRFNEIYGKFVKVPFPARSTVEVSGLPKNVIVEIESIACEK